MTLDLTRLDHLGQDELWDEQAVVEIDGIAVLD